MNKNEENLFLDDEEEDGLLLDGESEEDGLLLVDDDSEDGLLLIDDEEDGLIIEDEVSITIGSDSDPFAFDDGIYLNTAGDDLIVGLVKPEPMDFSLDDEIDFSFEGELQVESFHIKEPTQEEIDLIFDVANSEGILIGLDDDPIQIATEMGVQLRLDSGEVSPEALQLGFTPDGDYKPNYDVALHKALSPRETVLALYKSGDDEKEKLVSLIESLHEKISGVSNVGREAIKQLQHYLTSTPYNILTKRAAFTSTTYRGLQDYKSYLVQNAISHRQGLISEDAIIENVFKIWEEERYHDIDADTSAKIASLIREFLKYTKSVLDKAERKIAESKLKLDIRELDVPKRITDFHYECTCGASLPMPDNLPTLTFFIGKSKDRTPPVFIMNDPVKCSACDHHLAIPVDLAKAIENNFTSYVRGLKASYEKPRIYRPKLEVLNTIIPSDSKDLFDYDNEADVVIDAKSQVLTSHRSDADRYVKVIRYLMSSVEKRLVNKEEVSKLVTGSKDESFNSLVSLIPKMTFTKNLELSSSRYIRTLLHYLENFGLFKITEEQAAREIVYKKEGLGREFFDDEYAIKWLDKHAVFLASLKVVYEDPKPIRLNVRKEYKQVLTKILTYHFLADESLAKPGSVLASWIRNPEMSSDSYKYAHTQNKDTPSWLLPKKSKRDMKDTEEYYDIEYVWGSLKGFAETILAPLRVDRTQPPEVRTLISNATAMDSKEFYGIDLDIKKALIKPTPRLDEFKNLFMIHGHLLFKGVFIDAWKLNLVKAIKYLAVPSSQLGVAEMTSRLFSVSSEDRTDISDLLTFRILEEHSDDIELEREEILLTQILAIADLPEELSDMRINGEAIPLQTVKDSLDILTVDHTFMQKYEEVLPCTLQYNTEE